MNKIVILQAANCPIEDVYRDDLGQLSIVVPKSESPQLNLKEKELSNYESIISGYSDTFSLWVDHRSQHILEYAHYKRDSDVSTKHRGYYEVDGIVVLDGFIYVSKSEERPRDGLTKYEIQVIGTHQQWKELAKDFKVCESTLDADQFTWNWTNVMELIQNNDAWQQGSPAFYPLVGYFGEFYGKDRVTLADIRLSIHLWPLIKGAFCALGYTARSRFFESVIGRRMGNYLAPKEYPSSAWAFQNKRFYAIARDKNLTNTAGFYVGLPLDTDTPPPDYVFDVGDVYETSVPLRPNTFRNDTPSDIKFKFNYKLRFTNTPSSSNEKRIILDAAYGEVDAGKPVSYLPITKSSLFLGGVTMEGSFEMIVPAGNYVHLVFLVEEEDGTDAAATFIEGDWWNERVGNVMLDGDIINISKTIDPDLTLDELMIDNSILFNLGFVTDQGKKEVRIEPLPSEYSMPNNLLNKANVFKGYEKRFDVEGERWDLTDHIDLDNFVEKDLRTQEIPKEVSYSFVKSTDGHPSYNEFTEEDPPLSKRVTFSNGKADPREIKLKLYEPTLNAYVDLLRVENAGAPYLPIMWDSEPDSDNEIPKQGYDLGHRILIHLGMVEQYQTMSTPVAKIILNDTEYSEIPTCVQYMEPYISHAEKTNGEVAKLKMSLAFGGHSDIFDLYPLLHRATLLRSFNEVQMVWKGRIDLLKLQCWSPGMMMYLDYKDERPSRFNGAYKIHEITKDTNDGDETTVRVSSLGSTVSCEEEIPDLTPCDAEPIMKTAIVWFDASDINKDGTPTADGTQVTLWKDKTNYNNHLIQIGSESVPVKFTDNGRAVVEFSQDQLQTTLKLLPSGRSSAYECIVVMRTRSGTGSGWTWSLEEQSNDFGLQIPANGGAFAAWLGGTPTSVNWGGSYTDFFIWGSRMLRGRPNSTTLRRNGGDIHSSGFGANITTDNKLTLGRKHSGGGHQEMNICELVIFTRILSDEDRQCVEEYLESKWTI